jgi:hypothetical protein
VVVAELDVVRIAVDETEADAPLVIDGYGVLAIAITPECMESIAGRHTQVRDLARCVHGFQLPEHATRHIGGYLLGLAGSKQRLGLRVREGLDHVEV